MASQAPADSAPPSQAPEASKKTPEDISNEKAAAEAKGKLQLFRVTSDEKLLTPPHAAFALVPGPNHFEGPLPDAIVERFAALQAGGSIKVELIDGDGKVTTWTPPEKK